MPFSLLVIASLFVRGIIATNHDVSLRGTRDLQSFSIASLQLVEAASNQVVAELANGAVVSITPGVGYNINAVTNGSVGSVQFGYNGDADFQTENFPVWAFCGNGGNNNFYTCDELVAGKHVVSATPYSAKFKGGIKGATVTLSFTLSTGGPTTPATPMPVAQPVPAPVPVPVLPATPKPMTQPIPVPVPLPVPAPVPQPTTPSSSCKTPKFVGKWQGFPAYPIPAAEAQGAIIGDDLVVISGFTKEYGQATNKNFAINLRNPGASWRPLAKLPVAQGITHGAFAVVGKKLYMCGGYLGGHPGPHIDTCLEYNHVTNKWKFFESLPEGRAGGGMIYSSTNNVLVFSAGAERPQAGNPNAVDYQHTWMYSLSNPGAGWVEKQDIPYLTNHMSYVTTSDQFGKERHFFLAGQIGENEYTGNVDENYEWNVANENWIKRKNMPFTRGHASSSTNPVNCGYMIAAGSTNEFGKTKDVSYYDVPSNSWTKVGDLPNAINTPVCSIDYEGKWYICVTGWVNGKFAGKIKIEF